MEEPIWIEGRVEGDGAVVCDVTLSWDGVEDKPKTQARRSFVVITGTGDRVDVDLAKDVVLSPKRSERGPWREIEQHAMSSSSGSWWARSPGWPPTASRARAT